MAEKRTVDLDKLLANAESREILSNVSDEVKERRQYIPKLCGVFTDPAPVVKETDEFSFFIDREAKHRLSRIIDNKVQRIVGTEGVDDSHNAQYQKKRRIGIVFSGGPAPGGHNVIAGLYDAAKRANPETKLYGFLQGPDGIIENEGLEITQDLVNTYRNLGGFGMIKTGRTKIDSTEKVSLSRQTCKTLGLDALVIVGGDDSNTNAAFLAEEMIEDGVQVLGVPKTIDGDIQVRDADGEVLCAMSFGFHTAARSFAEQISNLYTDSTSDVKYWHICKVMGRVASHLALEVALQTHAHMTLIGEDLANYVDPERIEKAKQEGVINYTAYGMTLRHLSRVLCNGIVRRAAMGKNYGIIVLPEGVLEFINEIQIFIIKLNTIIAHYNETHDTDFHSNFPFLSDKLEYLRRLARQSREDPSFTIWNTRDDDLFDDIPAFFQEGLLTERDSHGNFQFSLVETDRVIMELVKDYLNILKEQGEYKVGIEKNYYIKTLKNAGVDPDYFGPLMFENYEESRFLLVKPSIISVKTLKQHLIKEGALKEGEKIPPAVEKIFKKSVPKFKTQTHFYGYDGRGSDPTNFDCTYTYNLGFTAFTLIANGATGQMAAIKNLEQDFPEWEPIGIPIAPLMHLEERKGKLELVLEKNVVDVNAVAFQVVKALREEWLKVSPGEDMGRRPGPIRFTGKGEEDRPITLKLNAMGRSTRS